MTCLALAAMLTVCGSSSKSGASTTSSGSAGLAKARAVVSRYSIAPKKILAKVPLPKKPPAITFAYLADPTAADAATIDAVKAAVAAIGWHYVQFNFDPSNPATLNTAALNALAVHPAMVSFTALPTSLFSTSVVQAYLAAKVPIEDVGSNAPLSAPFFGPVGSPAILIASRVLADWYVAKSGGGKSGVLLEHVPIYTGDIVFKQGFTSELKNVCPTCKINELDISAADLGANNIPSLIVAQLRANPSIKYVVSEFGVFSAGIYPALQAAGLSYVSVGGLAPEPQDLQELSTQNKGGGWMGYSVYYFGYLTVDIAVRYAMKLRATSGNALPTQLLGSKNIGNTTDWNAPTNSLQQFEKLWKVPTTHCTLACG